MTKILIHSNSPMVGTGYGAQTALFAHRLRGLGHDVAISAFFGLHGKIIGWSPREDVEPIRVYPGGIDTHGNDVLRAHFQHWCEDEPGLLLLLTDPWVMHPKVMSALPTLAWCPVDHDPLIDATADWFEATGAVPIAMSRFGEKMLQDAGFDPLYVPHGFDPQIFYPGDQAAARESTKLPHDKFIVGAVAANLGQPGRKCLAESLQAYALFAEGKRDVALYLHTQLVNPLGEPLLKIIDNLGLRPYAVDQYRYATELPAARVGDALRSIDVLLNPSRGEGFGLAMLEAQACGKPVITTNFSANPEVGAVGWHVGGQRHWTNFGSWQLTPNVQELVAALEEAYAAWQGDPTWAEAAATAHAADFSADLVTEEYWRPALDDAQSELRWRKTRPHVASA